MLSNFVWTEDGRRRHLATPIGPHLDGYLAHRRAQGFATATMAGDLKWATAFGEYLAEVGRTVGDLLEERDLDAFEAHYRAHPRRSGPGRSKRGGSVALGEGLRGSTRALLAYLRAIGAITSVDTATASRPFDGALSEYLAFLRTHRGLADLTVEQHRGCAAAFFAELGRRCPAVALDTLSVIDVEAVAIVLAKGLGRRSRQIMTTTIESLLRYLRGAGHIPPSCLPFLPRTRNYALSSLPAVVSWSEVERAVGAIDRTSPMGRRDYAMFLLVATYGLRASETVGLRLDDIDWRGGVLHIRQTKTRHMLDLPLVAAVRDALVAYLRDGRPAAPERHVFIKCHAPVRPVTRTTLYEVVRKAFESAGVKSAHFGPHTLRHARATDLLRRGRSLKTIGDLLGHRVPEATLIYCKVAVEDLRAAALELPGAAP
jgi:site-specific recombinase XerD